MTINSAKTTWQYLESRPDSWRKQLYIKGRKLRAHTVWSDMIVNGMTPEEIADSKELPIAAVIETIEYCSTHLSLIEKEAEDERSYLENKGVLIESKITH